MSQNNHTLDITTLENWLWEAACVVRGPLDGAWAIRRSPGARVTSFDSDARRDL